MNTKQTHKAIRLPKEAHTILSILRAEAGNYAVPEPAARRLIYPSREGVVHPNCEEAYPSGIFRKENE